MRALGVGGRSRANEGKGGMRKGHVVEAKAGEGVSASQMAERSNEVEAEERPVDLAIGKLLALGLAPASTLVRLWKSPN